MPIKVMSLNIWSGGLLMDAAIEFIKAQDPDILLLQEVYDGLEPALAANYRSMSVLRQRLGYSHTCFDRAYLEDKGGMLIPHGNAVFAKFELKPQPPIFLTDLELESYKDIPEHWPILPALLQHVTVELENGWLNVLNLHGVWDLDGDSFSDRRQKMSQRIIEQIKDLPDVILAGDSNAKASNQAMVNLENYLKPVFGHELKTTFNMLRKTNSGYASAAVDLMYVSANISVLEKDCPDVDVSDHLPIVVMLDV